MAGAETAQDIHALMARAGAGDAASQLRVSQLFRQAGDPARAQDWLDRSIAQGYAPALGERGRARLARLELAGALADLTAAAKAKDAPALLALAGLAATGVAPALGGWPAGMGYLIAAAQRGQKAAWRELALLTAMAGAAAMAQRLMAYAAELGDGIAVYTMLAHAEAGALDPQRAAAYRFALKRIGFPLTTQGEPAEPADFPAATAAPAIDWAALAALLREPPGLAAREPARLSASPDIWIVKGFFSAQECDYVVASGFAALAPARVLDPVTGEGRQDSLRTNLAAAESAAWMSPAKTALALRLARFAGMRLAQGEPAGLLCYRPGEEYRPHFDWLGPGPLFDTGGQRQRTVLVYLNGDYTGGQTRFLSPGLDIPAGKGDAALFLNVDADGKPDMTTRHAGMPVLGGVKYLWSQWYRERDVMPLTQ